MIQGLKWLAWRQRVNEHLFLDSIGHQLQTIVATTFMNGDISVSDKPQGDAQPPSDQAIEEKRHNPVTQLSHSLETISLSLGSRAIFGYFHFGDIFSGFYHTKDFKDSRAEDIRIRLRFLVFFFALAVPAYAVVDYFTLTHEHFTEIAMARGLLSLVHIIVLLISLRTLSILQVNTLLVVDILAVALFYSASIYILHSGSGELAPLGYTFMPLLIIVMLGLFPLTLSSSLLIMSVVIGSYLGLQMVLDRLISKESLDMMFLSLLFMGIVLWLQSGQLLMMLKLYRESTRDVLTGLINRRVLMKFLADEATQNEEHGRCFSVLMADIDRFKLINDTYGHFTGDLVLKAVSRMMENELRLGDIVARFGGEEFVAVLPGIESDQAVAVAERICIACRKLRVLGPDGREVQCKISIGVTDFIPGEDVEITLRRADEALYMAKQQGRNRVVYLPTFT